MFAIKRGINPTPHLSCIRYSIPTRQAVLVERECVVKLRREEVVVERVCVKSRREEVSKEGGSVECVICLADT
jgi:hypothetical protein